MKAYNQPLHPTSRRARVRGEEITRIGATRKRETGWSGIQSMRLAMAARTIRKGEPDAAGLDSTAHLYLWYTSPIYFLRGRICHRPMCKSLC